MKAEAVFFDFSICIPTYNRIEDLRACLSSIVAASLNFDGNVEVVISDNASTDGTSSWLRELKLNYDNISLVYWSNSSNIGLVKNVKKVGQKAKGAYVFFMSDDDLLFPEALNVLSRHLDASMPFDPYFIKCANITYLVKSKKSFYYGLRSAINDFHRPANFIAIEQFAHILSGCIVKNNKRLFDSIEDSRNAYPTIELCALSAGSCMFIPEPIVFHQWENEINWELDVDMTTSRTKRRNLNRDAQLALMKLPESYFDKMELTLFYQSILDRYCYVEQAIKLKFPVSKTTFLKLRVSSSCRRYLNKTLGKINSLLGKFV